MNCLEDENVCSVKKENNLDYYRLHTIWREGRFFINITSKNGAWRGEMTPSDIAKMSIQLEMEPDSYLSQCKEILTYQGGYPGMVYAVENGSFTWKKIVDEDTGIKIKMGSVMLEPTSFVDTIQNLVTAALNCNKNLQEKLKKITEENEKISENNHELLKKINELTITKETMENDLYARFTLLINAKKKKIQELENLLEDQYGRYKSTTLKNSNNPYETDTENDSADEIQKANAKKLKRKNEKILKTFSQLHADSLEEKKIKNSQENITSGKSVLECESYFNVQCVSPEPSSFTEPEVVQKESRDITLSKMFTKDELYDYFYGDV